MNDEYPNTARTAAYSISIKGHTMNSNSFKVSKTINKLIFDCDINDGGNITIHLYDGYNITPAVVRRIASSLMRAADMAEGRQDNTDSYNRSFYKPVNPDYQPMGDRNITCTSVHKDDDPTATI